MEYEPIGALYQGFEPLFGSQDPDLDQSKRQDPDPDQSYKQDTNPDPHQSDAKPQHCFKQRLTRDAEVGKDAVLLILVSGVGLEALALAVVPQLQRVVQRRRQDVLSQKGSG